MITLIDTSIWIEALRIKGDPEMKISVKELLINGNARITEPILLELFHGARGKQELNTIKELSKTVPILNCNEHVYKNSFNFAIFLRTKGFTLPAMDILIFSTARFYKANLLHKDSDFEIMKKI